jgi:hypothetical protein
MSEPPQTYTNVTAEVIRCTKKPLKTPHLKNINKSNEGKKMTFQNQKIIINQYIC